MKYLIKLILLLIVFLHIISTCIPENFKMSLQTSIPLCRIPFWLLCIILFYLVFPYSYFTILIFMCYSIKYKSPLQQAHLGKYSSFFVFFFFCVHPFHRGQSLSSALTFFFSKNTLIISYPNLPSCESSIYPRYQTYQFTCVFIYC